ADLAKIRFALQSLGRIAGLVQRGKQDANQHGDDSNHDQEFNKREAARFANSRLSRSHSCLRVDTEMVTATGCSQFSADSGKRLRILPSQNVPVKREINKMNLQVNGCSVISSSLFSQSMTRSVALWMLFVLISFPTRYALAGSVTEPSTRHAFSAAIPSPRGDANSRVAHEQFVAKAKAGGIDVYFLGDSITRRW